MKLKVSVDLGSLKKLEKKMVKGFRESANKSMKESGKILVKETRNAILTAFDKAPYLTGAMYESIRAGKTHNTKKGKHLLVRGGGVKRLGIDVKYARIVHEGRGYHKGNARRFMLKGATASLPKIVKTFYKNVLNEIK